MAYGDNQWTAADQDQTTTTTTTPGGQQSDYDSLVADLENLKNQYPDRQYTTLTGAEIAGAQWEDPNFDFWATYGEQLNPGGAMEDPSSAYAGMPIAIGYYDEAGNLHIEQVSSTAYQQYELANLQQPELQDLTQTEGYQGLQELLASLGDDQSGALQTFLNQMMGGDYQSYMSNLYNATNVQQDAQGKWDPFANMAGMGEEQKQAYEQWMEQQTQGWILQKQEAVDALAPYSSIAAFNQMDEITNQIQDFTTKARLDYITMDQAQKQLQYETMRQSQETMMGAGMQGTQIFYNQLNENNMMRLQTGMQMIDAVSRQNTQELQATAQYAQTLYNSIMANMAVETGMMNLASDYYDNYMVEYLKEYKEILDQIELEIGEPGTVICTELHRQGLMSDELYAADASYGWLMEHTDPAAVRGYRSWATKWVRLMSVSALFTHLVALLAIPWAKEMAYRLGQYDRGTLIGKILFAVGTPICRWIGRNYGKDIESYSACYR